MRDKTEEKIEELTTKVEELTLEIKKLEKSIKGDETKKTEKKKKKSKLQIGDSVRIKNPRNGQAKAGKVCRIGEECITVETKRGKVVRKYYNLNKIEEESLE